MTNSNPYAPTNTITYKFLVSLDARMLRSILENIANNYGITKDEAFDEVVAEDAENIMDYVTGHTRDAVSIFYKSFLLKNTKASN